MKKTIISLVAMAAMAVGLVAQDPPKTDPPKKNWKDLVEYSDHKCGYTRRDFLARGLATGFMSVALPRLFIEQAAAGDHADDLLEAAASDFGLQ